MASDTETIQRLLAALSSSLNSQRLTDDSDEQPSRHEKGAMKRYRCNVFDDPSDDDILSFNVGGTHLDVCRRTLTCLPSLLATKYSGQWDDSLLRDASGRFFVDAEPELFVSIVNYLRDYNLMLPSAKDSAYAKPTSFSDTDKQLRLERLLKSIHLQPRIPFHWMKIQRSRLSLINGTIQDEILQQAGTNYLFDLTEYVVQRKVSDNRRVVSFEVNVCMAATAHLRIGWYGYSLENVTVEMIRRNASMWLTLPQGRLKSHTIGEAGFLPTLVHDERINIPKKTDYKISCLNRGAEWYIDDKLVADTKEHSRLLSGVQPYLYARNRSGSVSFQLLHVDYEEDD